MRRQHTSRRWAGVAGIAAAMLLAACGSSSSGTSPSGYGSAPASTGSSSTLSSSGLVIRTAHVASGAYMTGISGRALYLFEADKHGQSACLGACASAWPPVIARATPGTSGAVQVSMLGTITRSDGKKQVTYHGHPLYYFSGDPSSGTTTGQGSTAFGARWWLVAPTGAAVTKAASSSSSSTSSSSSPTPSYGGGGY